MDFWLLIEVLSTLSGHCDDPDKVLTELSPDAPPVGNCATIDDAMDKENVMRANVVVGIILIIFTDNVLMKSGVSCDDYIHECRADHLQMRSPMPIECLAPKKRQERI